MLGRGIPKGFVAIQYQDNSASAMKMVDLLGENVEIYCSLCSTGIGQPIEGYHLCYTLDTLRKSA
jgi:hypothetical protein